MIHIDKDWTNPFDILIVIATKWVFMNKLDVSSKIVRNTVMLVA